MKFLKKYPMLGSSKNPEKISLMIKSTGALIVTITIAFSDMFGLGIEQGSLTELVNNAAIIVSTGFAIFGACRKIYYQIKSVINKK